MQTGPSQKPKPQNIILLASSMTVQALQHASNSLWQHASNSLCALPQADHPLMLVLTTAVAVGIYIVSEPLQRPWSLPCPILSQVLGLHS
jgi:hypothetical protein